MTAVTASCKICGAEFTFSAGPGRRRVYCSAPCRAEAARRFARANYAHGGRRKKGPKLCRWCQTVHTQRGQYYTESCRDLGHRERQREARRRHRAKMAAERAAT